VSCREWRWGWLGMRAWLGMQALAPIPIFSYQRKCTGRNIDRFLCLIIVTDTNDTFRFENTAGRTSQSPVKVLFVLLGILVDIGSGFVLTIE